MSNSTKKAETAETAAAVAAVETPAAPAATKYPASRLRKDCFALYGVSTSTFDGANVGVAGDADYEGCLLYPSPSPRDGLRARRPSAA